MNINETKYLRVKKNNSEKESFKIVKKEEGVYEITSVKLYYDKENKNLLKHAEIVDYIKYVNPEKQHSINVIREGLDLYNKENYISIKEFEETLKKAFGHFVRKIPAADIFIVRESKLDKKLEINYAIEDEPEIKVR